MANVVQVGPWGGKGGDSWLFSASGGKIFGLRYSIQKGNGSSTVISSLQFFYKDGGQNKQSPQYGKLGNSTSQDVEFGTNEDLTGIQGTYGVYYGNHEVISSLSFVTNKKVYGPYGSNVGTSFSFPVNKGKFDGFFGNAGDVMDSIGAVLVL